MPSFDVGDTVKLTFSVSVDGVLTDATLVVLDVTKPDGTALSPAATVDHPGTGTYTAVIAPDMAGQWVWKYTATGPGGVAMTVEDGFFDVELALSATYYTTVDELREELGGSTNLNINLLEFAVTTASRAIDEWCDRRFWRDTAVSARVFHVTDPWEPNYALIDDIATKTGLIVKTDDAGDGSYGTTWSASDFLLFPLNADSKGPAYAWNEIHALKGKRFQYSNWSGIPPLQITATWGWSQVPMPVRKASLLKAVNIFKRKDAPWGIAGSNEYGLIRITRKDNDIIELLDGFKKGTK